MGCDASTASKPEIADVYPGGMFIHLPANKPEAGAFPGTQRKQYMVIDATNEDLGRIFLNQLKTLSSPIGLESPIGLVTKSGDLVMPASWSKRAHSLRRDLQEDISDEVLPGWRMERKQKQLAALMDQLTAKQQELPNLLKVVFLK
jgi:hypothetical protein